MDPNEVSRFRAEALFPPSPLLREAVTIVYDRDPKLQSIEAIAGPLSVRSWPRGFPSLIRIILGQQLSSWAAQAIFERLYQQVEMTPQSLVYTSEATLKQLGLSCAKVGTCRRLSAAILSGLVQLEAFPHLSDGDVINQLTQVKGIGIWTAEVYLLFCLERLDSFPASDLAIQKGLQHLSGLDARPNRQTLVAQTRTLQPYRGAVAHLLWHYYRYLTRK
ncbi:MAG: DNA-3-methyladenine glycosylase family protein [Leptolyngbyaceae cyanobacterium]